MFSDSSLCTNVENLYGKHIFCSKPTIQPHGFFIYIRQLINVTSYWFHWLAVATSKFSSWNLGYLLLRRKTMCSLPPDEHLFVPHRDLLLLLTYRQQYRSALLSNFFRILFLPNLPIWPVTHYGLGDHPETCFGFGRSAKLLTFASWSF